MNYPAVILLAIYALFFLGLLIMAAFHLILIWRFAQHSFLASFSSGVFIIGVGLIILAAFIMLGMVDWGQSFQFAIPNFGISAPSQSL